MDRWVALRKESVDRNNPPIKPIEIGPKSLSARRAWIEILLRGQGRRLGAVALRKESVDRNLDTMQVIVIVMGRSPQGERG